MRRFSGDCSWRRTLACLHITATATLALGCAGVTYTPTGTQQPEGGPKPPEAIEIFLASRPPKPVHVTGMVSTHGSNEVADSLAMLRAKASSVGLDGVMKVICAPPGTVGYANCSGEGFIWATEKP